MKILNKTINDITVKDAVKVYVIFQTLFLTKKFVGAVGNGIANGISKGTTAKLSDRLDEFADKLSDLTSGSVKVTVDSENVIDVEESQE